HRLQDLWLGPHSLHINNSSIETDLSIQTPTDLTGSTDEALVISVYDDPAMAISSDGVAVAGDLTSQGALTTDGSITSGGDLTTDGSITSGGDLIVSGGTTTTGLTQALDGVQFGLDAVTLKANPNMQGDVAYYLPTDGPTATNRYLKAGTGT